jgi:pentatricopeptide repeat protein
MPHFIRALQNPMLRSGSTEGGGGGDPAPVDVAALVAAEVAKAVTGLKAKNDELLNEVKTERQKRQATESKIASFGSEGDIEKARELMQQMQADADLRMIAEGGKTAFDEVVGRRTKSVIEAEKRQREQAEQAAKDAQTKTEAAMNRWRGERLATSVNTAVMKAKALPESAEFIHMQAQRYFAIDDETGKEILREGADLIDRNGNPHTLETWVESLRDTKPFFFGMPQGGGAGGGGSGGGGGRGPTRLDPSDSKSLSNNLEAIASGKAVLSY